MLLKRIIPCLDVDKGRVVKGVRYVDHVDAGDPVEVAQRYDDQEADEITFLDITASHEGRGILLDVVARTAETVFMPLTVGGGVRSLQDVRDLLNAGADKVSIMTAAVENPDLVAEAAVKIGSANLVVAIDARRRTSAEQSPGPRIDGHHQVRAADLGGCIGHQVRILHRRGHDGDLVGAGVQQVAHVLERAHAAPHGQRHEDSLRRPSHHVEQDAAPLVAGGDVEEGDLVRLLGVVELGHLHRVAGVDVVDVAHALHDAALVDVEAGNDALQQHATLASARPRSTAPV